METKYVASCTVLGCPNSFLEFELISEVVPENVVCGVCATLIANVTVADPGE